MGARACMTSAASTARQFHQSAQFVGQWVHPASIEYKNAKIFCLTKISTMSSTRVRRRRSASFGVHRHEIIDAATLHRVSAVIDKCNISVASGAREGNRLLLHAVPVEIEAEDRFKANSPQCVGNIRRVILWVLQRGALLYTALQMMRATRFSACAGTIVNNRINTNKVADEFV
jgi:hypothetical protein